MTTATIDSIALAIEAALLGARVDAGGAFKLVGHWAGDLGAASAVENLAANVLSEVPAALIAFEGEGVENLLTTVMGEGASRGDSTWSVIVVATGVGQTAKRAQVVAAGQTAAYALVQPVIDVLNGLCVTGLFQTQRLGYAGTRWFACKRGALYALALRFVAARDINDVAAPDASVPYVGTTGSVDLIPVAATDDPVPASQTPFFVFKDA